jgi:hypothetical protein
MYIRIIYNKIYEYAVYYCHRWLALTRNPFLLPVHGHQHQRRKAKSVYGNTPVLWSTSFHSHFPWNNSQVTSHPYCHIHKQDTTRTRRLLLSIKYVPLENVMRTKWWPATGEQRVFKWQYFRYIATCSCTAVRSTLDGETKIDTDRQ